MQRAKDLLPREIVEGAIPAVTPILRQRPAGDRHVPLLFHMHAAPVPERGQQIEKAEQQNQP
jgi:hypothetical protein